MGYDLVGSAPAEGARGVGSAFKRASSPAYMLVLDTKQHTTLTARSAHINGVWDTRVHKTSYDTGKQQDKGPGHVPTRNTIAYIITSLYIHTACTRLRLVWA